MTTTRTLTPEEVIRYMLTNEVGMRIDPEGDIAGMVEGVTEELLSLGYTALGGVPSGKFQAIWDSHFYGSRS